MNYDTIKQLASKAGHSLSIKDLVALAPANDPFFVGRPSQNEAAHWFQQIWLDAGFESGVHLRRIHYRIVSEGRRMPQGLYESRLKAWKKKPAGKPKPSPYYQNTLTDWGFLVNAGKWARYLGLVDIFAFVDRRNPEAKVYRHVYTPDDERYQDPTPGIGVYGNPDYILEGFELPDMPELEDLPYRPTPPVLTPTGYYGNPQPMLIEIWCEKSTMDDILVPIVEAYEANLVTGLGELSITAVAQCMERAQHHERVVILYIADYDPAGHGMPVSVARKVEFMAQMFEEFGIEATLHPIALTSEQVAAYQLPRIPVKDSDMRKANWQENHGAGQVELDALEALHPGELAKIVTTHIDRFYDSTLRRRTSDMRYQLTKALEPLTDRVHTWHATELREMQEEWRHIESEWEALNDEIGRVIEHLEPRHLGLQDRLATLRNRQDRVYAEMTRELSEEATEIDVDAYPLPEASLDPYAIPLFDTDRNYTQQLVAYKLYRTEDLNSYNAALTQAAD